MENRKLNTEQVQRVKNIQQNYQALSQELGNIELQKIAIEARRKAAENFLQELQQEEKSIAEELEKQFGKGSVDLELGEFIPFDEVAQ